MATIHVQVPTGTRKPTMFQNPRTADVMSVGMALDAADEFPGSTILVNGAAVSRQAFAAVDAAKTSADARKAIEAFIATI